MIKYVTDKKWERSYVKNKAKQINGGTMWFFSPCGEPFFKFDIPENYLKVKKQTIEFTSYLEVVIEKTCEIEGFKVFKCGKVVFEADISFFSGYRSPWYFLEGDKMALYKQEIGWGFGFPEDKEYKRK